MKLEMHTHNIINCTTNYYNRDCQYYQVYVVGYVPSLQVSGATLRLDLELELDIFMPALHVVQACVVSHTCHCNMWLKA